MPLPRKGLATLVALLQFVPFTSLFAQSNDNNTTTPIKHVIVIIGENRTFDHVFATYQIDASRLAVGGFSDGAAFALLLGLANGDLFGHIIAFSPCVVTLDWAIGQPRVFVSHGTRDELAPASCTKQILAQLERMDLDVEYTEFEGGHRIPPQIARHAIEWLTAADESAREPCLSRSAENRPPREG